MQGKVIPCLLEHRQNLTVPSCKHIMTRMQAIFFSDYHLIENFLDDCSADVSKFSCGRLQTEDDEEVCLFNIDLCSLCCGCKKTPVSNFCKAVLISLF